MSNLNNIQKAVWTLRAEALGSIRASGEYEIALAYLLYRIRRSANLNKKYKNIREMIDKNVVEDLRPFVLESIGEEIAVEKVLSYLDLLDENDLIAIILSDDLFDYRREDCITPDSISQLALRILNIKEEEKVVDICSGMGSFLMNAYSVQPKANYFGIEINVWAASISKIRAEVKGFVSLITSGNALSIEEDQVKYDKGFMDAPLGIAFSRNSIDLDFKQDIEARFPELLRGTSSDWLFNYSLLERLNENGKAVSIVSLGSLWNTLDTPARITFAKMGNIESIILLPAKLYSVTNVAVALVVFNKSRCCGNIKFVDASQEFEKGRRQNYLSQQNIENILIALETETDISRYVQHEEIVKENFSFSPSLYIKQKNTIENGVPFKDVIVNITRGASCTADELDKMSSNEPTDFQYLLLSSIKNGIIDYELPYLKEIPPKMEKYCIKSGDLILSKNGYPFKVAVAEVPEGRKILASGNLFVIQLDTDKVNPYYIKAYLTSNEGIAALKSIVVGATIPNIGVAQLNTLPIPLIEKEKQDDIAAQYLAKIDEINLLKRKIEKAENALKDIFSFAK